MALVYCRIMTGIDADQYTNGMGGDVSEIWSVLQNVPYVFVPSKAALGRACGVARPVSHLILATSSFRNLRGNMQGEEGAQGAGEVQTAFWNVCTDHTSSC